MSWQTLLAQAKRDGWLPAYQGDNKKSHQSLCLYQQTAWVHLTKWEECGLRARSPQVCALSVCGLELAHLGNRDHGSGLVKFTYNGAHGSGL